MDPRSKGYLDRFLSSLPVEIRNRYQKFDVYHFCSDQKNADTCAELVIKGEKRATTGLLWGYEHEREPLPEVGQLTVITNWEKVPQCIIETTSVMIKPFKEVDAEYAFEEGEGDKSLEFWRKEHLKYYSAECEDLGVKPSQDMPVVLERFKLVYKK
jgi:uncharacterized protein YhfF